MTLLSTLLGGDDAAAVTPGRKDPRDDLIPPMEPRRPRMPSAADTPVEAFRDVMADMNMSEEEEGGDRDGRIDVIREV